MLWPLFWAVQRVSQPVHHLAGSSLAHNTVSSFLLTVLGTSPPVWGKVNRRCTPFYGQSCKYTLLGQRPLTDSNSSSWSCQSYSVRKRDPDVPADGYHISEFNFPAASLTCLSPSFPPPSRLPLCLGLDSAKYGLVTAAFAAGGLLGSLGSSWVLQLEGVKGAIMWTGMLNLVGAILETLAAQWSVLAAGR